MLLLLDHLALRARSYEYLIRLFQEWEVGVSTRQAGQGRQGRVRGFRRGWDARGGPPGRPQGACLAACLHVSASVQREP